MSSNRLDVEKESAMTEVDEVSILGLSKAVILQALFNSSRPQGMGFISSMSGPDKLDIEAAEKIISEAQSLDFDYLFGRPLKANLTGDSFDPWGYDRDNGGPGAAQEIIDRVRASAP